MSGYGSIAPDYMAMLQRDNLEAERTILLTRIDLLNHGLEMANKVIARLEKQNAELRRHLSPPVEDEG